MVDGILESEGIVEGWLLCWTDGLDDGRPDKLGISLGCDVGQCDTEG